MFTMMTGRHACDSGSLLQVYNVKHLNQVYVTQQAPLLSCRMH